MPVHILPAGFYAEALACCIVDPGLGECKLLVFGLHPLFGSYSIDPCPFVDKACGKEQVVNVCGVFGIQTVIFSNQHVGSESLIPGKIKKIWTLK